MGLTSCDGFGPRSCPACLRSEEKGMVIPNAEKTIKYKNNLGISNIGLFMSEKGLKGSLIPRWSFLLSGTSFALVSLAIKLHPGESTMLDGSKSLDCRKFLLPSIFPKFANVKVSRLMECLYLNLLLKPPSIFAGTFLPHQETLPNSISLTQLFRNNRFAPWTLF